MKPMAQLTEYGVTGGVFLLNLFIFVTLLGLQIANQDITFPHAVELWQRWAKSFITVTEPFTGKLLEPLVNMFLATLAVILIFCTGLLLELTAPWIFTAFEILAFKRWLVRKDYIWLDELMRAHHQLVGEDYQRLIDAPPWLGWPPQRWLAQRLRYTRLQSFIFSYLLFNAHSASLEQLQEQTRLWRTSRAVSASMIFLGVALTLYAHKGGNIEEQILLIIVIPSVLFGVSALTTFTLHTRLCMTLCSLLYLSSRLEKSTQAP